MLLSGVKFLNNFQKKQLPLLSFLIAGSTLLHAHKAMEPIVRRYALPQNEKASLSLSPLCALTKADANAARTQKSRAQHQRDGWPDPGQLGVNLVFKFMKALEDIQGPCVLSEPNKCAHFSFLHPNKLNFYPIFLQVFEAHLSFVMWLTTKQVQHEGRDSKHQS